MTTATYVRCALADLVDGQDVQVEARICNVELFDAGTPEAQAVIALLDGAVLVDVNVHPDVFAECGEHLRVGSRVTVTGEVLSDDDGPFVIAHTVGPVLT